ncbi:hypothetical protein [Streptomyces sp. N35]|uniref:hypothetical protein n=1 Tax=Streptomyces sp. N35 TaxID=2795730 RepID=UPI0018F4F9EA|nr:hypothetical protein [Streptomyces sp. N35]
MSARPELIRPDRSALQAAMDRTRTALPYLVVKLGEGTHTLHLVAVRADRTPLAASAELFISHDPVHLSIGDDREFNTLRMLLAYALDSTTTRSAVLIATTVTGEPTARACGWTVRDRWLHPMETAELEAAFVPCPGTTGIQPDVYPAPVLPRPNQPAEERS